EPTASTRRRSIRAIRARTPGPARCTRRTELVSYKHCAQRAAFGRPVCVFMAAMALSVVQYVRDAQHLLRDPSQFKWYTVTLLVLVMYVYAVEVERQRWDIVCAGLVFWLADWFNE